MYTLIFFQLINLHMEILSRHFTYFFLVTLHFYSMTQISDSCVTFEILWLSLAQYSFLLGQA